MDQTKFTIIEDFYKTRENKINENYQIIVSDKSIYLFNSSVNYGQYVKSLFSGIAGFVGLLGNTLGMIGGLASEITGNSLSKILKEYSEKSSKKNIEKLLNNLDSIADKKKGITKFGLNNSVDITVKKGYIINGMSSVEISQYNEKVKLYTKQRNKISELTAAIKIRNNQINIKTTYL